MYQSYDGGYQHKAHGVHNEGRALFKSTDNPNAQSQQTDSCNQLVGSTEDGPNKSPCGNIASFVENKCQCSTYGNTSCQVFVKAHTGKFLQLITCQTSSSIKRGQDKGVQCQQTDSSTQTRGNANQGSKLT